MITHSKELILWRVYLDLRSSNENLPERCPLEILDLHNSSFFPPVEHIRGSSQHYCSIRLKSLTSDEFSAWPENFEEFTQLESLIEIKMKY